jgi:putative phosphoesterase
MSWRKVEQMTAGLLVGVISDTHGLVRPDAIAALQGADLILHAGDIGKPDVLEALNEIAPVVAIRGNIDQAKWAETLPDRETVTLEGTSVYLIHNLQELDFDPIAANIQVIVSGHSHKPQIEERNGVLFVNPGSAGPRRFKLPIAVAHLHIEGATVHAQIIELAV